MPNPEDSKPSILFQILDLIIKDGFELENADLERMDVLYKHFVKEPNKESIQKFIESIQGILCKTPEQQEFYKLKSPIWINVIEESQQNKPVPPEPETPKKWYDKLKEFLRLQSAILYISLLLGSSVFIGVFVIKSECFRKENAFIKICKCIIGDTTWGHHDSIVPPPKGNLAYSGDNYIYRFYADTFSSNANNHFVISGRQTFKKYIDIENIDTLVFENPNAKDSSFIAFLHQTSPSGFSFKDTEEFSFKVPPPSNFAFVLPEPRYTAISDLELNQKFNWTLAITLFFLLGLLHVLFNRKKKQRTIVTKMIQETVRVPFEQNSINDISKGPYYLPLIDSTHRNHQMYENTEIRDMIIALNRRRDIEINKIDNHNTIDATLKRAGVLKVIYQPSYFTPKYLLLIKADNSRNHHYHFILDLVKHLEKQVQITVFIYEYSIHHLVELKANKVYQLSDLKNSYHNHQFVLWGDGYDLMDSSTEDIHHTIKRELNIWDNKILLTPVHPLLWNLNEIKLANYFYIDSSDIKGVLRLNTYYQFEQYEIIETKIDILNKQLHSMVAFPSWEQFENKLWYTDSEEEKKALYEYYVQRLNWYYSEKEYQLICCCALYENLYWDVTKALAIELYGERFFTDELVYNLCHLPWFIKGKIPAVFREILVQDIDADKQNELVRSNRDIALDLYEMIISQSTSQYSDSFAYNNMHLQVAEMYDNQRQKLPQSLVKYESEIGRSTNSVYNSKSVGREEERIVEYVEKEIEREVEVEKTTEVPPQHIGYLSRLFKNTSFSQLIEKHWQGIQAWIFILLCFQFYFILKPFFQSKQCSDEFALNGKQYCCSSKQDSMRFYNAKGDYFLGHYIGNLENINSVDTATQYYHRANTIMENDNSLINIFSCQNQIPEDSKLRPIYSFINDSIDAGIYMVGLFDKDTSTRAKLVRLASGFRGLSRTNPNQNDISEFILLLQDLKDKNDTLFKLQVRDTSNQLYFNYYINQINGKPELKKQLRKLLLNSDPIEPLLSIVIQYHLRKVEKLAMDFKTTLLNDGINNVSISKVGTDITKNEIRYYSQKGYYTAQKLKQIFPTFELKKLQLPLPEKDSNLVKVWLKDESRSRIEIQYNNDSLVPALRSLAILLNRGDKFINYGIEKRTNFSKDEIRYYDDSFKDSIRYLKYYLDSTFSPNRNFAVAKVPRRNRKASAEIWIYDEIVKISKNQQKIYSDYIPKGESRTVLCKGSGKVLIRGQVKFDISKAEDDKVYTVNISKYNAGAFVASGNVRIVSDSVCSSRILASKSFAAGTSSIEIKVNSDVLESVKSIVLYVILVSSTGDSYASERLLFK